MCLKQPNREKNANVRERCMNVTEPSQTSTTIIIFPYL